MTTMSSTQIAGPRRMRLKSMVPGACAPPSRSLNAAATGWSHAEHGPIHVPRPYTGRLRVLTGRWLNAATGDLRRVFHGDPAGAVRRALGAGPGGLLARSRRPLGASGALSARQE